jgi:hypothetical protein
LSDKIQKVGNKPWKQGIGKRGGILPKSNARNLMQVSFFCWKRSNKVCWISTMEKISRLCLRPLIEKKISLNSYAWRNPMAKIRV